MNWYCLRAATRQEIRVAGYLRDLGFDVYLPLTARWLRTRSDKTRIESALLPGYMFVRCTEDNFAVIREVEGVHAFVQSHDGEGEAHPRALSLSSLTDLWAIRALERDGEFDFTRRKKRTLTAQDRVRITSGLWTGIMGTVVSVEQDHNGDDKKATVLVDGKMGGRMKLGADVLEPVA